MEKQVAVFSAEDLDETATMQLLCKDIADVLERHYRGWLWTIEPDGKNGIVNIRSVRFTGPMGYTLHIANIQNDPQLKAVIRAGGELLERFGFRRVPYSYAEWKRREQVMGQFVPDAAGTDHQTAKRVRRLSIMQEAQQGRALLFTGDSIGRALKEAGRA